MSVDRLKVLFITHAFRRSAKGAQDESLSLLADALTELGVQVRVVAPDMRAEMRDGVEDARVERFRVALPGDRPLGLRTGAGGVAKPTTAGRRTPRSSTLNYLGAGFGSAVKVRRDFEPDLVHAHWWFPSGLVGSWLSALASLPLITSLHGFDIRTGQAGSPARPLFRHVLRRSAAITVESSAEASRLASVLDGVTPVIAPLPFATDLFKPASSRKNLVALVAGDDDSDPVSSAQLVTHLQSDGWGVVLVRTASGAGTQAAAAAPAGPHDTPVINSSDAAAMALLLGEARLCVVDGAVARSVLAAASLCGAPVATFAKGERGFVDSDPTMSPLRLDGHGATEQVSSLSRLLADNRALSERGEAARMYALATLAPESCAAKMLGVYLRALGDAAA
jgi:hypothetical protein